MRIEDEIHQKKFKSVWQKATLNIIFTAGWISNRHKDYFKPYGITPQQFNVLRILRGSHPESISTSVIKERMLDKNSDASRIVDRLTVKGLVKKRACPSDRRLVDVSISDEGLKLLEVMDEPMDKMDGKLGALTEAEADLLNQLLDKLRS